jgi:hypothetical protein
MAQEILLEQGVELRSVDVSEPVVIEAEIDGGRQRLHCSAELLLEGVEQRYGARLPQNCFF